MANAKITKPSNYSFEIVDKTQHFFATSFFEKAHFPYIYRLNKIVSYGEEGNPVDEAV